MCIRDRISTLQTKNIQLAKTTENNRAVDFSTDVYKRQSAGMEDVIIIETTGNELVAVKRNDIETRKPAPKT